MTTEKGLGKIIVSVAPVGKDAMDENVKNPVTPEQIARQVIRCTEAGASMVHLHVRDAVGAPTAQIENFKKTLDLIRSESDIVIQGSTGGAPNLTLEERCVSLDDSRVELASLNMGSVNFGEGVYINTIPDIRYWADRMNSRGVQPELEIFDVSMMTTVTRLYSQGVLRDPLHYSFCLGFEGALPADADTLSFLKTKLPEGSTWSLIHDGMKDLGLLAAAPVMGAIGVRVGFEDSVYYAPGRKATENFDLVESIVELLGKSGFEFASPREARAILGLKQLPRSR